jgi:hypothetical protein
MSAEVDRLVVPPRASRFYKVDKTDFFLLNLLWNCIDIIIIIIIIIIIKTIMTLSGEMEIVWKEAVVAY